jgi:hypothetical protein
VALKKLKEGTIKNSVAMNAKKFSILLLQRVVLKQRIWKDTTFDLLEASLSSVFCWNCSVI